MRGDKWKSSPHLFSFRSSDQNKPMNSIKYIRTKDRGFIIFSNLIAHDEMASMVKEEVLSAGFVQIKKDERYGNPEFRCYGESVSLKITSKEEDTDQINRQFELTYY